jgi:phage virion morphogenesis protein
MITINLGVEADAVRAALRRLLEATGDLSPVMREIGEALVDTTRQRFQAGRAPDGTPWARNSPVTVEHFLKRYSGARRKDGRGLTKKGHQIAGSMARPPTEFAPLGRNVP